MDKQTTGNGTNGTSSPIWWSDKHSTAWERSKEALRRDWEQTKADFTSHGGTELNQGIGDTVKQMAGSEALPPSTVKTHPDEPKDVAKRTEKALKENNKAHVKIAEARTDMAVTEVKAEAKIAQERHEAQEKIAKQQAKLGEIASDARDKIAKDERQGQEKLAKQHEKIAEVRAEADQNIAKQQEKIADARAAWGQIEPAVRYGYGARMEYADNHQWDETVEGRLRTGWSDMKTNSPWEDARPHVRRGWDSGHRGGF